MHELIVVIYNIQMQDTSTACKSPDLACYALPIMNLVTIHAE